MNYRQSENLTKTMDAAVRFIAEDNHRNAAKLFHKPGYTCELETERGRFFESVMPDKATAEAVVTVYWGVSTDEVNRERANEFFESINLNSRCSSGADSTGRVFSQARESYAEEEVSIELFEKMESDCANTIALYYDGLSAILGGSVYDLPAGVISYNDYYNEEDYRNDNPEAFGNDEERVKSVRISIKEKMKVNEDFLQKGELDAGDGRSYRIAFTLGCRDGSVIYLRFTDGRVKDGNTYFFTAKYFPDVSPTVIYPVTEWENIAVSMEQIKESMYGAPEDDECGEEVYLTDIK